MSGPVGVMALVASETAVGTLGVAWAAGAWGHARRGLFSLVGLVVTPLAWAGWWLARTGSEEPMWLSLAFAAAVTAWTAMVLGRASRAAGVLLPVVTVVGIASLAPVAATRGAALGLGSAEVALGALLLGSTVYGLVLGHWYIFERRLSHRHMVRAARWYIAGCVAGAGSAALSALNPAPTLGGFSPFLAVPGFSLYLAAGLIAVCALISGFTHKLATEGGRSIQAATGLFYLALLMAFSAELAAKVRFFEVA